MDERNAGKQREVKDSRQMEEKWQEVHNKGRVETDVDG